MKAFEIKVKVTCTREGRVVVMADSEEDALSKLRGWHELWSSDVHLTDLDDYQFNKDFDVEGEPQPAPEHDDCIKEWEEQGDKTEYAYWYSGDGSSHPIIGEYEY